MADRIVTWKALADFSKVRKEAAETQASLAALQAQVDKNNASNKSLGQSNDTLAQKEKSANTTLVGALTSVTAARQKATKAETAQVKASDLAVAASKREVVAQRAVIQGIGLTEAARKKSALAQQEAVKASLAYEAAMKREAAAAAVVERAHVSEQNAARSLANAKDAAAAASSRAAQAEKDFGSGSAQAVSAMREAEKASTALESAHARLEGATSRITRVENDAALAHVRVEQAAIRAASAHDRLSSSVQNFSADGRKLGDTLDKISGFLSKFQGAAGGASSALSLLSFGAMAGGVIELVSAVSALVSGLFALASAVAPAVGALAALGPMAGAAAGAFASVKLAFSGVGAAMKAYSTEQAKAGQQAIKTGNQQISSAQAIASAQQALKNAREQVGITERNTAQSIASASHTVTEAKYSEQQAEVSLNQARKDALQNILALKQAVIDAALAEKGATLGLADAQANLQRVMNDPAATRLQREQAQLAVDNAQNQLATSQKNSQQQQKDYTDAATKGVEGAKNVKDAKHAEAQAHYQVSQAIQAYNNAVTDGARANRQALQAVTQAEQALGNAQRSAAQAAAGGTGAANAYQTALNKLTPAQRRLVKELISFKDAYKGLKDVAAGGLLPGMSTFLRDMKTDVPQIRGYIGDTSTALGGLAASAGKMFSNPTWKKAFNDFGKENKVLIGTLGHAFLSVLDLFRAISTAAIPLTNKLAKGFDAWVTSMDKAKSSAAGMSKMTAFFKRTYDVLHQLGQIFKQIGIGIANTARAATPAGNSMLSSIQAITTKWAAWTGSTAGQNSMRKFFADVRTNVAAINHLLGVVGKIFIDLGANKTLAPFANGLTSMIQQVVKLFQGFGGADTGKKIGDILSNLVKALSTLGSAGGTTLSAVVTILDLLSKALVGIMKVPGAGDVLIAIAGAFALFKGLQITAQITQLDKLFKVASQFTKGFGATTGSVMSRIAGGLSRVGVSEEDAANGKVNRPTRIIRAIRTRRRGTMPEPGSGGTPDPVLGGGGSPTPTPTRRLRLRRTRGNPVDNGVRAANGGRDDAIRIMNNAAGGGAPVPGGAPSEEGPTRRQRVGAIAGRGAAATGAIAGVAAMAAQIPALSKYSGLLNTIAIVAGLASAAQALLNLAMEASPVMLIVTGIGLLVGALIYAYNHFKIVRTIINDIGKVFTWLWKSVLSPAIDWIVSHWKLLATVFAVLLGPIGLIGAAIALLATHWHAVWGAIMAVWNVVWTGIMAVWNSVGKPVFDAIATVVQWLWKAVLFVVLGYIQLAWKALMTYFQIWWAVGKAVFDAIAAVAQWLWKTVLEPTWNLIKAAWSLLWKAFKTDWAIGKAVFDAIISAVRFLWNSAVKPVFGFISDAFHSLWSGVSTVWNSVGAPIFHAISSVWDGIKSSFKAAWDWISSNFDSFVSGLGSIWKGIENAFMAPVKFVVNTVIDGWLLGNINKFLDFLGIPQIPLVPKIGGSGGGGGNASSTAGNSAGLNRADGGWIPGHTGTASRVPGTGNRDSVPAMLMPGEFVIRKRAAETLGHDNLAMLNRADGANVPTGRPNVSGGRQHFIWGGGVLSDIGNIGKKAWNATGGAALHLAGKYARKGAEAGLRGLLAPLRGTMHATLGHLGVPGRTASGAIDHSIEEVLAFIGGADTARLNSAQAKQSSADAAASLASHLGSKQMSNAHAIKNTGLAMGMSQRDVEVAFMTAMVESSMRNLANPNVPQSMSLPHDGIGSDHDSVGLFQQRNSWGSAATRLDPSGTSRLFFSRLRALGPGRNKMGMGQEAQTVQVSAFPTRYAAWQDWAIGLYQSMDMNTQPNRRKGGGVGAQALANGGPVLGFHGGGVVPNMGPGYNNNALSALATQAGISFPSGASSWSASMAAQARKRLSGVNKYTDVTKTNAYPFVEGMLSPDSSTTKGLMSWVDRHDPKSYNAMWSQQPYGKNAELPNSAHKNPLLPILSYVGGTSMWKNHRKAVDASDWATWTAQDKAYDRKHKRHGKYDLRSEQARHPSRVAYLKKADKQWATDLNILSHAASLEKTRVSQMRAYLGLKGAGNNGGLFSGDMQMPLDHAMAHAVGQEHPADWAHPWSGGVTSVEQAIADSDRSNALNKEWFGDLQQIAEWGMPELTQYLMDKGITDGLQIARDAVKSKSSAQQLNDSIKAGKSGFGGLTGSDQDTALKIVAKLSSGTAEKPFGLRDVSGLLQVPDYAVVNMFDKMQNLFSQIDPAKLTKFNSDVGLFRQGLFYAATGGKVPGTGSGDTVPAMLTPGEFVVRKKAVEALGLGTLHDINHADTQNFATGGPVLAPNVSASPSLAPGAFSVHTPKVQAPGVGGNTYVTEINTEINNPSGENSVYSMNKMLRRKAATGQFNRENG